MYHLSTILKSAAFSHSLHGCRWNWKERKKESKKDLQVALIVNSYCEIFSVSFFLYLAVVSINNILKRISIGENAIHAYIHIQQLFWKKEKKHTQNSLWYVELNSTKSFDLLQFIHRELISLAVCYICCSLSKRFSILYSNIYIYTSNTKNSQSIQLEQTLIFGFD